MSQTALSDLPRVICEDIRALLPDLKECKPHAGKFSIEELKAQGLPSPSVLVSVLGAKQDQTYAGAAHSYALSMVAYVVVRDGLGAPRDVRAANICQLLLTVIPGQRWLAGGTGEARAVRLHTLVSTQSKNVAVSLWAVTWDQPISFFEPEPRILGAELYVSQAPKIGAEHEGEYTQVGGQA